MNGNNQFNYEEQNLNNGQFNSQNYVNNQFQESNNIEKSEKNKNIIIIILILIIFALAAIIFYLIINKENNDLTNNNPPINNVPNNNDNANNEPQTENLNLDDELVGKLYSYIGGATAECSSEEKVLNFYQDKKVTIENLSLDILAQGVLNNQFKEIKNADYHGLSTDELLPVLIKMYNLEENTKLPDKYLYFSREGAGIECIENKCLFSGAVVENIKQMPTYSEGVLTKAAKTEDYIYLYDSYSYKCSSQPGGCAVDDDSCDIVHQPQNETLNYKHTFKKYENSDDYYWVSTEPIK